MKKLKFYSLISLLALSSMSMQADIIISDAVDVGEGYVGVKMTADEIDANLHLINQSGETIYVNSISGFEGTDFSYSPVIQSPTIVPNENFVAYWLHYKPTVDGATSIPVVFHTTAGDFTATISGTKVVPPAAPYFEGFESEIFPPLGWAANNFSRSTAKPSGDDYSATALQWGVTLAYITTPRLDLSSGNEKITFDYVEDSYDEFGDPLLVNWQTVLVKQGDGDFVEIWNSDNIPLNGPWERITLDLSDYTSDNSYVRFVYNATTGDLDYDRSEAYFDNIILPKLFGDGKIPASPSSPTPVNNAKDILYGTVELSWRGSLFAEGYKLYISDNRADVVAGANGIDLGNVYKYTVSGIEDDKVYYWRIAAYNEVGDSSGDEIWAFTTQEDATVSMYPYFQGFEKNSLFPPKGWSKEGGREDGQHWRISDVFAYEGTGSLFCSRMYQKDDNIPAMLETCVFNLPEEGATVSFVWANNSPGGCHWFDPEDASDTKPKTVENDSAFFEVRTLDSEVWKTLAINCSEYKNGNYYSDAVIDLSAYSGQQVKMRFRYNALDAYNSNGVTVDNFTVDKGSSVGANKLTDKTIIVYPTRTTGTLNISEAVDVEIFNMSGAKVGEFKAVETIDVSNMANGVYILRMKGEGSNGNVVKITKY